ncbi:FadR/GntR family transcriptional regulator [Paraburkholderia dioscoreae]|uniref:Transcriptional regulator, GntR family n=1 Tax=Paraburkholderia dioscoreae TaxID=2604047 RepID=A0A5Q4YWK5_9BURK|nr:FadR/GntR family transcriptional regulator [Paraburkholderia dioscoreae]VVD33737.1 Transcriptional regulator, GntR family [Paraburkholderia dioscoreae]
MKDPTATDSEATIRSPSHACFVPDVTQSGFSVRHLQPARVGDKILDHIRLRLSTGDLAPGDKLPSERDLAEQLGVSRNAVRESLRVLEAGGVLTIRKGHTGGAFVSNGNVGASVSTLGDVLRLRGGQVREISEVRLWMSGVVARAACERRTSFDLEKLNQNLELVQQTMEAGDLNGSLAAAAEFHVLLAACSQNSLLVLMMETIMGITSQFACDFGIDASEFALDERRAIVKAIEARKVPEAITAMMAHLDNVHSRYRSAVGQT